MKYPQLISMPSEISDWLEEQLEARGIDAVVYTRYILSLLHRDSTDIICQDQDPQFKQFNKDLKYSRGSRKRFRCSSGWWGHSQPDADQLKRSAAVECLLSASDENCGIESLVDELCEKLKKCENDSTSIDSANIIKNHPLHDVSTHDLARQYYAAFPPLSYNSSRSPNAVVTFLPNNFTSPKKKGMRRRNRSSSCGEKLLYKKECDNMKSRTNGKHKLGSTNRNKNDFDYFGKSVENCGSNTNFMKKVLGESENINKDFEKEKAVSTLTNFKEKEAKTTGNWDISEREMYEDLPVDIIELLDSPSPHDYTVEMMNLANIKEVGNKSFIHSGTNITSSIWSVDAAVTDSCFYKNKINSEYGENHSETVLGFKFSALSMDCNNITESTWPYIGEDRNILDNSGLLFADKNIDSIQFRNPCYISTASMKKWSQGEYANDCQMSILLKSLIKINHNRELSSFTEVCPKTIPNSLTEHQPELFGMKQISCFSKLYEEKEEENLLTSDSSHFKPICLKKEMTEMQATGQCYADGTSFLISSNLDKPNYKRSSSGSLYLESETGSPRKILEFNNSSGGKRKHEFVLKFFVKQNDKACQTDTMELNGMTEMEVESENAQVVPCKKRNVSESEFYFPGDRDLLEETCMEVKGTCNYTSPDSTMTEITWKYDNENYDRCSNCRWSSWILPEENKFAWQLDKDSLRNIWNGGEVCTNCSNVCSKFPLSDSHQTQLREDISQDGEQLLSDLSTLQRTYMEHLPVAEMSYDINELLTVANERKRRHSPLPHAKDTLPMHRGSWSIASSIKQDHLMQMNSIPVLHSVTL